MEREGKNAEIKGWLLALALAVILTWYVMNPVPRPSSRFGGQEDLPEADRAAEGTQVDERSRRIGIHSAPRPMTLGSSAAEEKLPEWPEYLDLD